MLDLLFCDYKQVAEKLMIMHEECLEGNYSSIEKLRHANNQGQAVPYTEQVWYFFYCFRFHVSW